jgi:two-component system, chemotaxis family, protein-glutamate methylesterase/glutaminase
MGFDLAVLGTSLGGLRALEIILTALPKDLSLAIAIVQHRHRFSEGELVFHLQQQTALSIVEATDKQTITAGRVYLAPADYHLLVEERGSFALSADAPVCHARPAIDVLFESAADAYSNQVVGIILTGASQDGARGLAKIAAAGGLPIVQNPNTAESDVMPKAAIAAVPTARVMTLSAIASLIAELSDSNEPARAKR